MMSQDNLVARGLAAVHAAAETVIGRSPAAALVESAAPLADAVAELTFVSAERARIAAIVSAPEAKGRESLANHLAFNTDMAPADAITILKAAPAAAEAKPASRLDQVMQGFRPHVDSAEHADDATSQSAGLHAALTRELKKLGKAPKAAA
jgi:hypothetical protein